MSAILSTDRRFGHWRDTRDDLAAHFRRERNEPALCKDLSDNRRRPKTSRRVGLSLRERFDANWEAVTETGCWIWTASLSHGYGQLNVDRKIIRAHRIAWLVYRGPIPSHLFVCHHCDTRICCNPDHLYLGTAQQNSKDAFRRGRNDVPRNTQGERAHFARLTAAQVIQIRADPRSNLEVATELGMSRSTIEKIRNRLLWKHIP